MSTLRLTWLEADSPFPPASQALADPPGLLAAGADLSIKRLHDAYSQGIFPWYQDGEPLLWWSPDPRMVLVCEEFHPSHSLRKRLRQIARNQQGGDFSVVVRVDSAFSAVLRGCSRLSSAGQPGTWITREMQLAYLAWHLAGQAHSIETWVNGELAGGLYGVSLGKMFFGESMFSQVTDASKIALAHLVSFLRNQGITWIDCQMQTEHLQRLGARPVTRADFLRHIKLATTLTPVQWTRGWINAEGRLIPGDPARV